jgi:hypothetical protein
VSSQFFHAGRHNCHGSFTATAYLRYHDPLVKTGRSTIGGRSHGPWCSIAPMKQPKAVSLIAALGVLLAAMMTVVAPLLDLECGRDPGHIVGNFGGASSLASGTAPATQANPCDHQSATTQQKGETGHVHGMNAQALPGIPLPPMFLGTPMLLPLSWTTHLAHATVLPTAEPPRTSV